ANRQALLLFDFCCEVFSISPLHTRRDSVGRHLHVTIFSKHAAGSAALVSSLASRASLSLHFSINLFSCS
ncbi:hypothetical protein ACHAWF_000761, partial [Thalassiosira exigua]